MGWRIASCVCAFLYFIIGLVEICGEYLLKPQIYYIAKPFLMPALLLLIFINAKKYNKNPPNMLYLSLFFAWIGDIALLFQGANYFILGLISFLIAHIIYIKLLTGFGILKPKSWQIAILFLFIGFAINIAFQAYEKAGIIILAIIIYELILLALLYAGLNLLNYKKSYDTKVLILGISLFIISDCMIAINRFVFEFANSGFYIMISYIVAQFLIATKIQKIYATSL